MLALAAVAVAALPALVSAHAVSTSVFPNTACAGASSAQSGLVGVGTVVLSNGEIETHCGCPSDNLPNFQLCPSALDGESVCNSVLNLDTGSFSASCGIVACSGAECPRTVVNTVVVDELDCSSSDRGLIGITTDAAGERKCSCTADVSAGAFELCQAPENGRAACTATDDDFLGTTSYDHAETVQCSVICDMGFEFKSGACVKATQGPKHAQRDLSGHDHHAHYERRMFWNDDAHALGMAGPSASKTHRPSASATWGPSKTHGPSARPVMPPPHDDDSDMMDDGELDDVLQKRDHLYQARPSPSMSKTHVGPSPSPMPSGSLGRPVHGRKEDDGSLDLELWKRLFEQNFFGNTCTAAERQCPTEDGSEETQCVRLDDVRQCGGCHSTGTAVDCLAGVGIEDAMCLRQGCVVKQCAEGFVQTGDDSCAPKA